MRDIHVNRKIIATQHFFIGWGFYCAGTEHIRIAGVFEETVFSKHRFSTKQVCYSCPAASVRVNPVFIYE